MAKTHFAMFMAGATVGAAGAWLYLKRYYEQIAQEEIDSVKAAFAERKDFTINKQPGEDVEINKKKADMAKLKPDLVDYAAKLQEQGYTNYSAKSEKNNKEEENLPVSEKPYIISPEEYGDFDDYTKLSLTYYSDGTLADDEDEIIDNIDETVGSDFAEHFGDYEDDSVFIRNDRLKCDYEILRDNRSYTDVTGVDPEQED